MCDDAHNLYKSHKLQMTGTLPKPHIKQPDYIKLCHPPPLAMASLLLGENGTHRKPPKNGDLQGTFQGASAVHATTASRPKTEQGGTGPAALATTRY